MLSERYSNAYNQVLEVIMLTTKSVPFRCFADIRWPGKVFAAEKSPVGRQRGGMDGFEDAVALGIGDGAFALGVTSHSM